jgi:hypothetical protein
MRRELSHLTMALTWFSTKAVDELADSIIAEIIERFPSGSVDLSNKKAAERAMRTLERMYSSIGAFAIEHRPNLYQKARFGNRIKWGLKDARYPEPFIEIVTHEFVKQLTLTAAARKRGG